VTAGLLCLVRLHSVKTYWGKQRGPPLGAVDAEMKKGPASYIREAFLIVVGGIGIEPMTPSVSGKCSPTELTAHGSGSENPRSIPIRPGGVKRFCSPGGGPFFRGRAARVGYARLLACDGLSRRQLCATRFMAPLSRTFARVRDSRRRADASVTILICDMRVCRNSAHFLRCDV
jgi:hypothetical protein